MATNKRKHEKSDVNKAPRIFTFNDLSENVCLAIAKFWVLEERLAYQRINQMVGRCCDSLWNQQKDLPQRLYGDAYAKCCLRSPNLRVIDLTVDPFLLFVNQSMYRMRVDPVLIFEKCPRIDFFMGTLANLIQYVTIHKEQNYIKSIIVKDFGDFSSKFLFSVGDEEPEEVFIPDEEEIKSGMKLLAENLIHLETIEWGSDIVDDEFDMFHSSGEYLEALGRRASSITSSSYRYLYEKFKPGSNLLKLDCKWLDEGWSQELPRELPERHPNLRALYFVNVSLDSFRILNGLQFLESVELDFDGETIAENVLEMFRSFLSRHIHLKRLIVFYRGTQGFKQIVEDICRFRPTIESLSLQPGNLHIERDNIFTPLLTLRNLREFELKAGQKRGECFTFAQVTQLLAVCPKLRKVTFQPVFIGNLYHQTAEMKEVIAEHEVQGRQYHEEHPNRKVQLIFNI